MIRPKIINILGKEYSIEYVEKPSDVDIFKRSSLWGQIDYWTRSIRIYDGGRTEEDIFQTVVHEILHGIESELHLKCFNDDKGHDELDLISVALTDVLVRNKMIILDKKKETK